MTARFICPHCHSPIDPQSMEAGCGADAQYRICPDCDQPILLDAPKPLPKVSAEASVDLSARSLATATDGCVL